MGIKVGDRHTSRETKVANILEVKDISESAEDGANQAKEEAEEQTLNKQDQKKRSNIDIANDSDNASIDRVTNLTLDVSVLASHIPVTKHGIPTDQLLTEDESNDRIPVKARDNVEGSTLAGLNSETLLKQDSGLATNHGRIDNFPNDGSTNAHVPVLSRRESLLLQQSSAM